MYRNNSLIITEIFGYYFAPFENCYCKFHAVNGFLKCKIQKVQTAANWKIILVYWIPPTLLNIVVLKDTNFHFDGLEDMAIVAEKTVIQVRIQNGLTKEVKLGLFL